MKISITHTRAIQGNDITVTVDCNDDESVTWVETRLDGFVLATDALEPAEQSYERSFTQAGDAGPSMDHELTVEAINRANQSSHAIVRWADPI